MTFDDAMKLAKTNPGLGVREAAMQARWKIIFLKIKGIPGGGDYFCINPITGSDYRYTPKPSDMISNDWSHAT